MNNEYNQIFKKLLNISNEKYINLKKIYEQTVDQKHCFETENISTLQKIINSKQEAIRIINSLDNDFETDFILLKQKLGIRNMSDIKDTSILQIKEVKELRTVISNIFKLLNEISIIESQIGIAAKQLLKNIGNQIKIINQSKKLISSYNPFANNTSSYYIDKKK